MSFKDEFQSWLIEYLVTPEEKDLIAMITDAADALHQKHKNQDIKSIYKQAYDDAVPVVGKVFAIAESMYRASIAGGNK